MVPHTWLPCLNSGREICLIMQTCEMPLLVDTTVVPVLFGEIKRVRGDGLCKVNGEMGESRI